MAELVAYVEKCVSEYPQPTNGQIRAIPDERTIRYYGTIGLLDKPIAMKGRTALYGRKHVAQIIAIKRLQVDGRSLAEIQAIWPTIDDLTLARMSGVQFPPRAKPREGFWKAPENPDADEAFGSASASAIASASGSVTAAGPKVELRVELAPDVTLLLAVPETGLAITKADLDAIRAAAAQLVSELAQRQLAMNARGEKT